MRSLFDLGTSLVYQNAVFHANLSATLAIFPLTYFLFKKHFQYAPIDAMHYITFLGSQI